MPITAQQAFHSASWQFHQTSAPPKQHDTAYNVPGAAASTDTKPLRRGCAACAGCQAQWDSVKGLPEALGDGRVVSNYSPKYAPLTFEALKQLRSGHAIFTMPK
jgi:hypothetical protein